MTDGTSEFGAPLAVAAPAELGSGPEPVRAEHSPPDRSLHHALFTALDAGFCVIELAFGPDGCATDYRFVETNPAFEAQTGLIDAEGRWMRDLAPDHEQHWFDLYGRVALTGEPLRFESEGAALGRWFDVHAHRVGAPADRRVALLFNDITARKVAETALRDLNETLELRVEQRTRELLRAEEALRQSQKLEAIGQLTGGVAHDFNNLLTIIKSSTNLMRRPDLSEERRLRYIAAISETVDRGAKLTGQLLAFARRQALNPEVFDVSERAVAIGAMIDHLVGSRMSVTVEAPERIWTLADMAQFETALVNLAVNARDAMAAEGELILAVTSVPGLPAAQGEPPAAAPFVAISLTDTGSGIAEDRLSAIFEPFYTTKEVGQGTGLGLSQVYGFVKQSGGDVAVRSRLGEGTTFTLYLPRVPEPARAEAEQATGASASPSGEGRRVLVVEDNAEVGTVSMLVLQDLGYDTVWAASAEEALAQLGTEDSRFDAVFSDVVMPGMSGVELGRELRQHYPGLPVLLTSGYSHVLAEDGRDGFELLRKPYAAEDLGRTLSRMIARSAPARIGP